MSINLGGIIGGIVGGLLLGGPIGSIVGGVIGSTLHNGITESLEQSEEQSEEQPEEQQESLETSSSRQNINLTQKEIKLISSFIGTGYVIFSSIFVGIFFQLIYNTVATTCLGLLFSIGVTCQNFC